VGIAAAGGAIGLATVPFVGSTVMTIIGWRDTYLFLGIAYLIIAFPLALLVRSPMKTNAARSSRRARSSAPISPRESLRWICSAVLFCCVCMSVPIVHVVALAGDVGLSTEQAVGVLSTLMLTGAAGRVLFGRVADRLGPLNAYILASLGQAALVFGFVRLTEPAGFYVLAGAFGLVYGGVMTSIILTVRSLVPEQNAGTATALALLFGWVAMGLGAYGGGLLFDWTGTYAASFGAAAIFGTVNVTLLVLLAFRLRRATQFEIFRQSVALN
jgi:predicted MFS family arabinose efflux permease